VKISGNVSAGEMSAAMASENGGVRQLININEMA